MQDANGDAAALGSDEEEGSGPKPGRQGRKSASAAGGEAAMLPAKSKQKGQQLSKERRLAAQAERQRRAELELLLMDDTALRDAAVAGVHSHHNISHNDPPPHTRTHALTHYPAYTSGLHVHHSLSAMHQINTVDLVLLRHEGCGGHWRGQLTMRMCRTEHVLA